MNDVIIPPPTPTPLLVQNVVQRGKNAANTSVFGHGVAKGMETCDNVSCSTSLSSMLQKEAKTL